VLGTRDLPAELSACGMPVSLQVERLRRDLAERGHDDVSVFEVDLYTLIGSDRDAAIDAIVGDVASPYVLLDGRLVCAGSIDSDAVLGALSTHLAHQEGQPKCLSTPTNVPSAVTHST